MNLNLKIIWLLVVVFIISVKPNESRYLPTRAKGDDLDKLRELMIDILDSSNESHIVSSGNTRNNLNENDSSKLTNSQRFALAKSIFGANGEKDDELTQSILSTYFGKSGSGGNNNNNNNVANSNSGSSTSAKHNPLSKYYGRIVQY